MLFNWTPNFVPNKVFVFGCGGTGSRVVPLIAQFIKSCSWVVNPEIVLIDFDIVEEKNLFRQNFVASDVGKNKAAVLANRYSKAFGITLTPITTEVTLQATTQVKKDAYNRVREIVRSQNRANNLFLLCVDSPEARRDIMKTISYMCSDTVNNLVIDAGNENDFGQVTVHNILGMRRLDNSFMKELRGNYPVDCDIPFIPCSPGYYDEMKAVTTDSCVALDQSMAINCLMAVNIFSIVQNIYYVKKINFFRVNISLQHGAIPEYLNIDYFVKAMGNGYSTHGSVEENLIRTSLGACLDVLYDRILEFKESQKPKVEVAKVVEEIKPVGKAKKAEEAVVNLTTTDEGVLMNPVFGNAFSVGGIVAAA